MWSMAKLAHPSQSHVSLAADGDWLLESGIWSTEPGWKQLLAPKRQLEGILGKNIYISTELAFKKKPVEIVFSNY